MRRPWGLPLSTAAPLARWQLGRYVRVITPTGRHEYMRVIEVSPLHYTVKDAESRVYVVAKTRG